MKIKYMLFLAILTELFLFSISIHAQEGLHLVGTITGISEKNLIINGKGIGDFNGDGYKDFIVNFNKYTNLYYGSKNFDTAAAFQINSSFVYPVGDVNNDGYDDLMIGESDTTYKPTVPVFKIYKGGKELDTVPIFIYKPEYLWDMMFSSEISDIGDLNGDGYRDFIISSPYNWDDGRGRIYVFHGGDTLSNDPVQILSYKYKKNGTTFFGSSVTGIDDINKDGKDDILIYEEAIDGDSGNVQVYYGSEKLDSVPSKILLKNEINFGRTINNAGDINKNGRNEFIITSYYKTYIYFNLDSSIIINNKKRKVDGVTSVCTGGDINSDGYNDFLISNDITDSITAIVNGYYGNSNIDTLEDFNVYGVQPYSSFAFGTDMNQMQIAGDLNNDGYDDVLITALAYRINQEKIGKVYIYSYKELSTVKEHNKPTKAEVFRIKQNYPNPFNPRTIINYELTTTSSITIKIFDALGKEIVLIDNGIKPPGEYSYSFNSNKYNLSSGAYLIQFIAKPLNGSTNIYHKVIKAVLLK